VEEIVNVAAIAVVDAQRKTEQQDGSHLRPEGVSHVTR
jgi:hypothetical protein